VHIPLVEIEEEHFTKENLEAFPKLEWMCMKRKLP
jgi:hypothetical protein